ncbi:MAG: phospho-sugar mutase [Clostridiaceae bacterium]|nr:phospho-sugar mutase [Clostridiaceae bacterium]
MWQTDPFFDEETRKELTAIKDDPAEIEERFYQNLEFGTAGLRGILGAGTNRMNIYTVAWAAEGFASYVDELGDEAKERGIAISYDSRHYSPEFAEVAACIFAKHKIKVHLYPELRPVPMLSFAVRYFNCVGGIMITASHNPKEYNGFKAYGEDGSQLAPEAADIVMAKMNEIDDITTLSWPTIDEALESGYVEYISSEVDDAYINMLKDLSINGDKVKAQSDMKIIYTPLHGAGNKPVRRILKELGFTNVIVVPEQAEPDPDFSTVKNPNPEYREALELAIQLADKEKADLVIANDPDADRTGLAVRRNDGSYQVLTGNQIGLLLMEYILSAKSQRGELPDQSFVATTIVSTKLTKKVAAAYDVDLYEVLTGFKFIGELIKNLDEFGDQHFQFGFEESFGYLSGTDVRDKDAVVASMLLAEMAATARDEGLTISDYLDRLYEKYGYGFENTISISMEGITGLTKIQNALTTLREDKSPTFGDVNVKAIRDYKEQNRMDFETGEETKLDLPESNVLLYEVDGLDWFCVRPSGTEPKIKVYTGTYGDDREETRERLDQLTKAVENKINALLD